MLRRIICIYAIPVVILISTLIVDINALIHFWYLYCFFISSLAYAHISWEISNKEGLSIHILVRKVFFAYFFIALIPLLPKIQLTNIIDIGSNNLGIDEKVFLISLLFIGAVLYYIFVISNFDFTEFSFGNAKLAVIKDNVKQAFDSQMSLNESLIDKIKAEHQIIQNMSDYCAEIKERVDLNGNFNVADEFRRILNEYVNLQSEKYNIGVITDLNEQVMKDYQLKKTEFDNLVSVMVNNEYFQYDKDTHFLFFPYEFGTTTLYIVIESILPIIIEENYVILNILKELEESVLTMFYIEEIEKN